MMKNQAACSPMSSKNNPIKVITVLKVQKILKILKIFIFTQKFLNKRQNGDLAVPSLYYTRVFNYTILTR